MRVPRIHHVADGEPVTISLKKVMMLVCCDCLLTHLFRYTVRGQRLTIRAWRDDDLTRVLRKRKRHAKRR